MPKRRPDSRRRSSVDSLFESPEVVVSFAATVVEEVDDDVVAEVMEDEAVC